MKARCLIKYAGSRNIGNNALSEVPLTVMPEMISNDFFSHVCIELHR